MKTMTSLLGLTAFTLAIGSAACGDDTGAGGGDTTSSKTSGPSTATVGTGTGSTTSTGMGIPDVPALGVQIDRMGRPAINTATTQTFTPDATREAAQDAFNADGAPATWVATYAGDAATALGILDSLDANCGNQAFSGGMAGQSDPDAYSTLGGVLANDYLVVNGAPMPAGTCTTYLAVEVTALGIANTDCGGRKPSYDVIASTYSVVAGTFPTVFDDTIAAGSDQNVETFPYLAAP